MKIIFLILSILSPLRILSAQEYFIDNAHSSVSFKIKHLSVADIIGAFEDFSGSLHIQEGRITKLEGIVNIDSVNTFNEARDSNLRSEEFFSRKTASLKLIDSTKDKILATLNINGIDKEVEFSVKIAGPIKNPNLSRKQESKKPNDPLIHSANLNDALILSDKNLANQDVDDCGCYVTYGDNVVGVELDGIINRFDYKISRSVPKELLGEYAHIKIILEASR